jgi:hypothetical protein
MSPTPFPSGSTFCRSNGRGHGEGGELLRIDVWNVRCTIAADGRQTRI